MQSTTKKSVINRLNRIEGQLRGLRNMIEQEEYCIDIITQSSAIRQALSSLEDVMLKNHLETHVIEQIENGDTNTAADEILTVFKKHKK